MSYLSLSIDRQARKLVAYNGGVSSLPSLFQGNTQPLYVTALDPTGSVGSAAYTKVDLSSYSLRVSIGATPTGTAGGPTPAALQTTFTWDATNLRFSGSIALNTSGIDSLLGSAASVTAYFEVDLVDGSANRITILQDTLTLKAVVDEMTTTVPTPTDQYLTANEVRALLTNYLKKIEPSPNGVYGRELGVDNDGSAVDNIVTL